MNLPDLEWPTDLPLPAIEYDGVPFYGTSASELSNIVFQRRKRFQRQYNTINVTWRFTDAQKAAFESFYIRDTGLGAASFHIELRFPLPGSLSLWIVRLAGNYEMRNLETIWEVKAGLELLRSPDFTN